MLKRILIAIYLLSSLNVLAQKPNIIFILTDDMGYGDLSLYGSPINHTPHIDKLARRGTVFNRAYAASAVCTPSRAALLTGKYPLRYNIQWAFKDEDEFLPLENFNLPRVLQKAGYRTAHIGKWHLGGIRMSDYEKRANGKKANPGPHEQGFDHYLCNIEDPLLRKDLIKQRKLYREGGKTMVRNDERAPEETDNWEAIKVNESMAFMDTVKSPFFINLWFDTPHTPYEPMEPFLEEFKELGAQGDQLLFRSMIKNLDHQIGRLIKYLDRKGMSDNTLIIFGSDNGAAFQGSPGPFIGHKTDLHNGGLRVPFFVVWPDKIAKESYSFQQVHYTDILPTICDALDLPLSTQLDGQSLWSSWSGKGLIDHKTMLWQISRFSRLG